ncbi:patatin-like phospholipase family protein, partial [Georgenia sp. 10Sc9-8]|nr:patatin-like phospholipase family protein [Georgenia halotolerans]
PGIMRTLGRGPRPEPVVGLVLSGGGARSSFQLGALRYLYDQQRIAPSVITGTSAGSILAGVLAQHGDHAGQRRSLAELERLWPAMESSADLFTELPWSARLRGRAPAWAAALGRHRQRGPGRAWERRPWPLPTDTPNL